MPGSIQPGGSSGTGAYRVDPKTKRVWKYSRSAGSMVIITHYRESRRIRKTTWAQWNTLFRHMELKRNA